MKIWNFVKAFLTYIGFFLVFFALLCKDSLDIVCLDINGKFNVFGKMICLGMPEGGFYFFSFMFLPIIMIGVHKISGWLDTASGFSHKVSLWVGLICSILLIACQVVLRVKYSNHAFYMNFHYYPNAYIDKQNFLFRTLIIIQSTSMMLIGFCIFSFFIAGTGYEYVEITTYYTDTGSQIGDSHVSDAKIAIWMHIVLGVATSIVPIILGLTPLVVVFMFLCIVLLIRHKSVKSLVTSSVINGFISLILIVPVILTSIGTIETSYIKYSFNQDKNLIAEKCHYSLDTKEINIPTTYDGIKVSDLKSGLLKPYTKVETLSLPMIPYIGLADLFDDTLSGSSYGKGYKVPKSVQYINFYGHSIGEYAFTSVESLKRLLVSEYTLSIHNYAFYDTPNLELEMNLNQKYISSFKNPYHAFLEVDTQSEILKLHEDTKTLAKNSMNYITSKYVIIPKGIVYFNKDLLIYRVSNLEGIFYQGTVEDAKNVVVDSNGATKPFSLDIMTTVCDRYDNEYYDVFFYSEDEPNDTDYKYWRYDADGVTPVEW